MIIIISLFQFGEDICRKIITMPVNTIPEKFPNKISEYMKQRFGEAFVFEAKTTDEEDVFYKIKIRQDDLFYILKFDELGYLMERDICCA